MDVFKTEKRGHLLPIISIQSPKLLLNLKQSLGCKGERAKAQSDTEWHQQELLEEFMSTIRHGHDKKLGKSCSIPGNNLHF